MQVDNVERPPLGVALWAKQAHVPVNWTRLTLEGDPGVAHAAMRFMIYGADSGQLRLAVHRPAISVTPINGSAAAWADTSASLDVYQLHLGRLLENVVGLSHISHYQAQHGCDAPVADDSSAVGSLNPAAVLEGASCCCKKKLRWCNLCVLVALNSEPVEFDLGTAEQTEASLSLAEQSSAAHWQMPLLVNFAWTSLPDGHLVLDGSVAIGTTADTEAAVWDASASAGPAGGGSTNAHFGQPLQLQETYYLGLGKPATVCADSMRTLPWHFPVCTNFVLRSNRASSLAAPLVGAITCCATAQSGAKKGRLRAVTVAGSPHARRRVGAPPQQCQNRAL